MLEAVDPDVRQLVMAVAYLLCDQRDLHREFPGCKRGLFARRVFGAAAVDDAQQQIRSNLTLGVMSPARWPASATSSSSAKPRVRRA